LATIYERGNNSGCTVRLVRFLSLKLKGFPDNGSKSPCHDVLPLTGATQFEVTSDLAGGIGTKPIHYKHVKGIVINVPMRNRIQEMIIAHQVSVFHLSIGKWSAEL
jgi:hypothetical protein